MEKRFKGINDMAKTPEDGLPKLKKLISNHLGKLPISKKYIPTIQNQVAQWLGIWELWQNRNDRVVEVWALFWLYRTDGHLQWTIKVIWGKYKGQYESHHHFARNVMLGHRS
jgi:hypothetical protein